MLPAATQKSFHFCFLSEIISENTIQIGKTSCSYRDTILNQRLLYFGEILSVDVTEIARQTQVLSQRLSHAQEYL